MRFVVFAKDKINELYIGFEIKRFYPEAEILICKDKKKARDFLENSTVDALISDEYVEFNKNEIESLSFTAYEDYFYESHYEIENAPVAPLIELIIKPSKYLQGNILTLPGRVSKFLEDNYNILKSFKINSTPIDKNVIFNDNYRYYLYYKNPEKIQNFYRYFVKPVRFIGAGIGNFDYITLKGLNLLKHADICLHDSLIDKRILNYLPAHAKIINVGKRCKNHSAEQPTINELLVNLAKKGLRVVRLKSGDPSIFGRLAEEIEYLRKNNIPYEIVPGLSCINTVSTSGIILTKRRTNRGFSVISPIKHGGEFKEIDWQERKKLPIVLFMSVRVAEQVCRNLINEGLDKKTKALMIFNIGNSREKIIRGNLENIYKKVEFYTNNKKHIPPGLFIIGDVAEFEKNKNLLDKKVVIIGDKNTRESIGVRLSDIGASVEYLDFPPLEVKLPKEPKNPDGYTAFIINENLIEESLKSSLAKNKMIKENNFLTFNKHNLNRLKRILNHLGIKEIYYFYIKQDFETMELLKSIKNINIFNIKCTFKDKKRETFNNEDANILIFENSDYFWAYLEFFGREQLSTCETIWIPKDNEILNFLIKENITNFSILPDLSTNSDIWFILDNPEKTTKSLILSRR